MTISRDLNSGPPPQPPMCPVVREALAAHKRAKELGIKTVRGVLLYIADRLEMKAGALYDTPRREFTDAAALAKGLADVGGES